MMNKIKAFYLHLLFSAVLLLLLALVVYGIWYPLPYSSIVNPTHKLILISAIIAIVFPCLTALIYKQGKKTLKMDITVIVLLQLLCLGFGTWVLAQSRPAWIVLDGLKYYMVRPIDLRDSKSKPYIMPIREQNWGKPKYTQLVKTISPDDRNMRREGMFLGTAALYPDNYAPITVDEIQSSSWKLSNLQDKAVLNNIVGEYPQADFYIPLVDITGEEAGWVIYDNEAKLLNVKIKDDK